MNKHKKVLVSIIATTAIMLLLGNCKKQNEWLDVKNNKNEVVPKTLNEFQAVLDFQNLNLSLGGLGLIGTDNVYITEANLKGIGQDERNTYLWAKDLWQGSTSGTFFNPYNRIETANIILDGLENINPASNPIFYDSIKGQALFLRAHMFYLLAQLYCKPYTENSADMDLGLQLRISSDPNIVIHRSTVKETYDLMIKDLKNSNSLLPKSPTYKTRSSQLSANALLAKVFLSMEDYHSALEYSKKVLDAYDTLLDFNSPVININNTYPFPAYSISSGNPEIIYYGAGIGFSAITAASFGRGNVNRELYDMYHSNDLRKTLFYTTDVVGNLRLKGTYTGNNLTFFGMATNEIYLVYAESCARTSKTEEAIVYLNKLLQNRYKVGTFNDLIAGSEDEVLRLVLEERRKELAFTGQIRWEDLRRLNKDPRYAKTITHTYLGVEYKLTPNDNRYVFPIPDLEIQLSQIPQNER